MGSRGHDGASSFSMRKVLIIIVVGLGWWLAAAEAQAARAQGSQAGTVVRRPVAKSQQEYDDFESARKANNGAILDKAASEFAEKYPDSELRRYLFSRALRQYQSENNSGGMLAMGARLLAIDPGDTLALVLSATVVADGLSAGDPEREIKVAEIRKYATRALQASDASRAASSQPTLYRTTLQSMAYSALGIMKLKTGDDAGAERDLKAAADLPKIRPDPYIWYHLALAQDHRKKYRAARNSVEQALQLASANPRLQRLAEAEHERLNRLTGPARVAPESGGDQPPE